VHKPRRPPGNERHFKDGGGKNAMAILKLTGSELRGVKKSRFQLAERRIGAPISGKGRDG